VDGRKHAQDFIQTTNEPPPKKIRTTPTIDPHVHNIIPFVPRAARHPNKYAADSSKENLVPSLISGDDSDFTMCLENGCLRVHRIVLKTCSLFKNTLVPEEVSIPGWISGTDDAVMDALECLYSRRVEHMNGCPGAELADLVHILVYWGAHNVLEQLALSSKKTLEVVLEKLGTTSVFAPEHGNLVEELIRHTSSMVFIFSQNDIQYISPTGPSVHASCCLPLLFYVRPCLAITVLCLKHWITRHWRHFVNLTY
jgi:hypothetical protein